VFAATIGVKHAVD